MIKTVNVPEIPTYEPKSVRINISGLEDQLTIDQ